MCRKISCPLSADAIFPILLIFIGEQFSAAVSNIASRSLEMFGEVSGKFA